MILLKMYFLTATLGMTAFSYLCGYITGHQFREPELLNQLIATSILPLQPSKKSILGWILHIVIGYIFGLLLLFAWEVLPWNNIYLFNIVLGVTLGIIGIIGWHIMIKLNPNPPKICLKNFYL